MRPVLSYPIMLISALCMGGAVLADVYRWVDEAGNPVFTDTPVEGAEKLELGEPTIVPAQVVPRRTERLSPEQESEEESAGYKALSIASPSDGATIRNVRDIPVGVRLEPGLRAGHKIQFLLDGSDHGEPVAGTSTVLSDIDRGEHQVGATLIDEQGEVLLNADPVTIYLHQTHIGQHPGGS